MSDATSATGDDASIDGRSGVPGDPSGRNTSTDRDLPPSIDGYPLLGNTVSFLRDPFAFYDRIHGEADVVRYSVAGREFCALFHPDDVEQVLVSENERYRKGEVLRENASSIGSEGLLLTEGDQWRRQREVIQSAFTPDRIRAYTDAMVSLTERRVEGYDDGQVVTLDRELSSLTLEILARSLFDLRIDPEDSPVRATADALNERGDASSVSAFLPDWVPTPANRRFRRSMDAFDDLVGELIAERREGGDDYDDLLALLLDATDDADEDGLTESEVRDQMVTFLFAGHETTALALTYALKLLAHHPDQRRRLQAELDEVLGGRSPTMADLPDLSYLDRVTKETLRLFPPAYVLFRTPTTDVTVGGYRIPEATEVVLPIFRIHRDPRWYDDPHSFRPDRWTDEAADSRPDYAYFPFGGGPRHCIGMRFARTELRLVLATLLQSVDVDPVGGELQLDDLTMAATLRPQDPVEARIRER